MRGGATGTRLGRSALANGTRRRAVSARRAPMLARARRGRRSTWSRVVREAASRGRCVETRRTIRATAPATCARRPSSCPSATCPSTAAGSWWCRPRAVRDRRRDRLRDRSQHVPTRGQPSQVQQPSRWTQDAPSAVSSKRAAMRAGSKRESMSALGSSACRALASDSAVVGRNGHSIGRA